MINEIEGLERVRFMTSHPKDLTVDVIMAIKECDKLCEQIHLPVQSGIKQHIKENEQTLYKRILLRFSKEDQEEIPGVTLTTDIIVGFPGETEEDFQETLGTC